MVADTLAGLPPDASAIVEGLRAQVAALQAELAAARTAASAGQDDASKTRRVEQLTAALQSAKLTP